MENTNMNDIVYLIDLSIGVRSMARATGIEPATQRFGVFVDTLSFTPTYY